MSASGSSTKLLRSALVASAALVLVVAIATPADAYYPYSPYSFSYPRRSYRAAPKPAPVAAAPAVKKPNPEKDGFVDLPKGGILQIAISIGSQRLTLYRDGVRVAQSPVSTGTASHPTPTGVFSVIEKDRYHRSNLYGNAPMFYMQRVTWSGVAMHEGVLPGYAASHGCIRLPTEFAARLWPTTKLGVRVIIAHGDATPVDFQHASLFQPRPKPEPKVAALEPVDLKPARLVRMAEATTTATDAGGMDVTRSAADAAKPAATAVADDRKPTDAATAATEEPKPAGDGAPVTKPAAPAQAAETAPDDKATGTVSPAGAAVPVLPSELRKAVETPQPSEPPKAAQAANPQTTPVEAAPASNDPPKPELDVTDPFKPTPPRYKSADQPLKRNGQVAVFVSRKEKKIFIRHGFIPIFEMPITIDSPDQPLGTHVFTAMGFTDGGGMRWNLISYPHEHGLVTEYQPRNRRSKEPPKVVQSKPPSTAAQALDRIQMPPEAVERIAELLSPGSSLVISDEGLGRETGRMTEFIVLTR
ncbi:MAG: L,D-transpeptidase family protein [Xanthobacteraceae bacterium]